LHIAAPSNFLDDDDTGTTSPPLHDQSAEIGNVQNQFNSTNRSLETTKTERANVEQTLANQAAQLSALQTQLSSAKAAYETETKLLSTLRERHAGQIAEIQKTREELIRAESDLSAIRVEKAEVERAFLRDKEEARDLHRKMVETGTQVEQTKAAVEKARRDAKQQKGLLAIARKQLSTKEVEKAKAVSELEEANRELTEVTTERIQAEGGITIEDQPAKSIVTSTGGVELSDSADAAFAAGHALPVSPDPSSPSGTISPGSIKSNNPFDRINAMSTPRSQSPFPFVNSSLPTSPEPLNGASVTSLEKTQDPFGFSQAVESEHQKTSSVDTERAADGNPLTPRPSVIDVSGPSAVREGPTSPESTLAENDDFTTPPTSATSPSYQSPVEQNQNIVTKFPDVESTISQFPPLDSTPNVPGHFGFEEASEGHGETDLHAQLKEVEGDDSSSDSDDEDEDEQPLAVLAAKNHGTPIKGAPAIVNGSVPAAPTPSFNDVFETPVRAPSPIPSAPVSQTVKNTFEPPPATGPFDAAIGAGFPEPTGAPESAARTKSVAGVNEFDEAMGIIPSTSSAPPFSFDSAFDDNFDFSSASGPVGTQPAPASTPAFPPAPANINGKSPVKKGSTPDNAYPVPSFPPPSIPSAQDKKPFSFVDAFGSEPVAQPSTSEGANPAASASKHTQGISFDEAFSGIGGPQALHLDSAFSSPTSKMSGSSQPTDEAKPFPSSPVEKNRTSSPLFSSMRSASPPPARPYSPKGRASTSSSKESHEKPKEQARHSKLSVCTDIIPFRFALMTCYLRFASLSGRGRNKSQRL
jgi:epidermal growth factor receptor substrate 15